MPKYYKTKSYTVYAKCKTGYSQLSELLKGIRYWSMIVGDGITSVQVYSKQDAKEVIRRLVPKGYGIYQHVSSGPYQCKFEEIPEKVLVEEGYVKGRDKD